MILDSREYTNIGGRDENQDAVRGGEQNGCGLYVVADGLGGHRNGKAASEAVITAMFAGWPPDLPIDGNRMYALVKAANEAVRQVQKEQFCSCKSTVASLAVSGRQAVWACTGDSRIYRFRGGQFSQLNKDHSVAFMKYRAGEITKEQIPQDEEQNILLRSLGGYRWEPDIGVAEDLAPGDAFLLCSDGFWELVGEADMAADRADSANADAWAERMLRRAASAMIRRTNCDNLSVITVILG